MDRKNKEKMDATMKASPAYGSLLAECITDIVANNTKKYGGISLTMLVKKVRGLQTYFYEDGLNAGKFNLIPNEEVEYMVYSMVSCGILATRVAKGEYVKYDKYYFASEARGTYTSERSGSGNCRQFNDQDWLNEVRQPSGSWDWMDKLALLDHTEVYCVAPEEFVRYFASAPEDVITYIQMLSKMEEKPKKKICEYVVAEVSKKA